MFRVSRCVINCIREPHGPGVFGDTIALPLFSFVLVGIIPAVMLGLIYSARIRGVSQRAEMRNSR
ncbi:MAG: hypothetical protein ABI878_02625 [Acidobacteriota bacterium]